MLKKYKSNDFSFIENSANPWLKSNRRKSNKRKSNRKKSNKRKSNRRKSNKRKKSIFDYDEIPLIAILKPR